MAKLATKSNPRTSTKPSPTVWTSRAVNRLIEAGSMTDCTHCEERVKFKAREKLRQVICNVYVDGRWDRVEHFHAECYSLAEEPHGSVSE